MVRALRIPSSYLPTGPEDSQAGMNDGKVGNALIQEFRFNQYCQRLQKLISGPLDTEFKAYLKWCGVNIDSSMFNLTFNPPQNFAHYRQAELDQTKIGTFSQLEGYAYFSKRWLMKRFLGMTEEEMSENQRMWREEKQEPTEGQAGEAPNFRSLGVTPGGIQSDLDNFPTGEEGELGGPEGESVPPPGGEGAGAPPCGGPLGTQPAAGAGGTNPA